MKNDRTCWLILNPISGAGKNRGKILQAVKNGFQKFPGIQYQIKYTKYAGHATVIAASAAEQNINQIIAVGGDGTLNEVASGLVQKKTALSLIPTGSGNGFARSLGVPLQIEKAVQVCLNPREQLIDVGVLNEKYFFGIAGLGLDAAIGASFQHFGVRGPIPYFYIGLREFFMFKYEEIQIDINDKSFSVLPLLITVANTSQYGNGAIIAPMAKYNDGMLDLCVIRKFPCYHSVFQLPRLFSGTIDRFKYFDHYRAEKIRITRSGPGYFHTDGEPHRGGEVLELSIKKKALKIWC